MAARKPLKSQETAQNNENEASEHEVNFREQKLAEPMPTKRGRGRPRIHPLKEKVDPATHGPLFALMNAPTYENALAYAKWRKTANAKAIDTSNPWGVSAPDRALMLGDSTASRLMADHTIEEISKLGKPDNESILSPRNRDRCACCEQPPTDTTSADGRIWCARCWWQVEQTGQCTVHNRVHYPELAAKVSRIPIEELPEEILGFDIRKLPPPKVKDVL
jgi:hypothetical protein